MSSTSFISPAGEVGRIKLFGETILWAIAEDENTLREVLAREVAVRSGLSWRDVEIVSRPGMSPRVEIAGGESTAWQVSLSYTERRVAGALAHGRLVGIDFEWIDPEFQWEPVAREFFPEMISGWQSLPYDEARREFFQHWVCLEAILKCRGTGFTESARSVAQPTKQIQLSNLDLGSGYVACLAWVDF